MNKIFISILILIIVISSQILKLNANDNTYINSSNITYNEKKNIIELSENSKINFKNTNILIDKGIIDYNNNSFEVFGDFYLYEDLTILSGKDLKGNTNLDFFKAKNVSYIYNNDLKIDTDELNRNKNLLNFNNSFLTPCEIDGFFNCPTWSLRIDKTTYDIKKDKFTHFDTFLQIADYKVFYMPYFSHYGAKAPRQKGLLTPSIEFTIGGNQSLILPYYIPIGESTDITIKTKVSINSNFELLENYEFNTLINNKNSSGITDIAINNIKNNDSDNINNTFRIDTKQTIDKFRIISASGLFTNSISTTRSINEEPVTFEDLFLRFENYNFYLNDDYFKTEISSVESFDSTNVNTIPILLGSNYFNQFYLDNVTFANDFDIRYVNRSESSINNPSESLRLSFNNQIYYNSNITNFNVYNKIYFLNSLNDYYFNKDTSLNSNSIKSFSSISTDLYYSNLKNITPRIKFILPLQLANTDKSINEDSVSLTFNYQNQFSENRFFGNDLFDNSPRVIYGLENELFIWDKKLTLNINQSLQSKSNNSYAKKINQESKFSDFALEANMNFKDVIMKLDSRLNQNDFSKKEMNYSLNYEGKFNASLGYHETKAEAYEILSSDTQTLNFVIENKLNNNIKTTITSDLDIKNNYEPYKSTLMLSFLDECSQLDISYSNTRFNDNFNTQPDEKIGLTFRMDYLGFFGYEQTTDLFFSQPGNINYGL